MKASLYLALLCTVLATATYADSSSGIYVGGSVVRGDLHNAYQADGGGPGISIKTTDTGFKLFGGYTFNRFVGIELEYIDGLSTSYDENDSFIVSHSESKISAFNLSALGKLPVSEYVSLLAKAGYSYWNTNDRYSGSFQTQTISGNQKNHEGDFSYGAGVAAKVNTHLQLRTEYEVIKMKEGVELRMLSAGASWRF
ncbi:MAG: porin family protein [Steroidobacter sp.]